MSNMKIGSQPETFDVPMIDPTEMEIRPVLAAGRHGLNGEAELRVLDGRKGRKWDDTTRTFKEDETSPVAHFEIVVIDPEVGIVRVFHDEAISGRSNSRFPKWAAQLGFPREQMKGQTVGSIAEYIGVPLKVVVEVALNGKGDRNTLRDILPLEG